MELRRISEAGVTPWQDFLPAAADLEAMTPVMVDRRQLYLDAFQVPAAVIGRCADEVRVTACNDGFRDATGGGLDRLPDLARLLREFLGGPMQSQQLRWRMSGVGGRHYCLHLSRLAEAGIFAARALVSMVDRTAEVEAERTWRAEVLRDSLTGLPNRAAFDEAVDVAAEEPGEGFALLAIDLVRFSGVNQALGALGGDELILAVARRLREALPSEAMLARTAGDEFGILVRPVTKADDVAYIAGRLRATLAQPIRLAELEINIDVAIGCALWGERSASAGDMINNAQVALKRAKTTGRIELYRPGEVMNARRRFTLETDLRRAIERDQLTLAFQPILDLETGAVSGFEGLARWTHEEHGAVSPAEFIQVAEESGLIVPLGRWALQRAARTLAEWDRIAGVSLPVRVSVNVSAVQLARDSLVEAVDASGIDPARLTLELTESSIVAEPDRASRVLAALHARDCAIAMDDFGTGYSSLAYLQRLPIDVLKIDRSLVTDMHSNRDSMAIIRAVLSLARALGMTTTAEGIERAETASMLGALGCATGQGYYFARPLPPDDALAFYLTRSA